MDIEERMAKTETEIAILKQIQVESRAAMERGFSEQRTALAELRSMIERGFALVLGIIAPLAGAF